jgi:hypothetical protein
MSVLGAIALGAIQPLECESSKAKLLATRTGCRHHIHGLPLVGRRKTRIFRVMAMGVGLMARVATVVTIVLASASARS